MSASIDSPRCGLPAVAGGAWSLAGAVLAAVVVVVVRRAWGR